jgi:hypothetical protein
MNMAGDGGLGFFAVKPNNEGLGSYVGDGVVSAKEGCPVLNERVVIGFTQVMSVTSDWHIDIASQFDVGHGPG